MPSILRKRSTRIVFTATTGLLVATLGFFAWQSFYPVQAAAGWKVGVLHSDVTKAASLLPQADGSLLVSRELDDGRGSILKIAADGARVVVINNLSKPDGMVAAQGGWVFSQEGGAAPVSLARNGKVTPLFDGDSVQGLWNDGKHLYAIEDRKGNGRLMRYDWQSGQLDILRSGLTETEGLTRCRATCCTPKKPRAPCAPWPTMAATRWWSTVCATPRSCTVTSVACGSARTTRTAPGCCASLPTAASTRC